EWGLLLGLGWDLVSLDAQLSLGPVLASGAFEKFHAGGGALSLGIVPTDLDEPGVAADLVAEVKSRLPAEALQRALLTPACGLALRSVPDAERIFEELRTAQRLLRAA